MYMSIWNQSKKKKKNYTERHDLDEARSKKMNHIIIPFIIGVPQRAKYK